jgi:hypothetical protein
LKSFADLFIKTMFSIGHEATLQLTQQTSGNFGPHSPSSPKTHLTIEFLAESFKYSVHPSFPLLLTAYVSHSEAYAKNSQL